MKKLDFTTGGVPNDVLDYFDWLQGGVLELSHALSVGLKNGQFTGIYVGISESGGQISASSQESYFIFGNEVYQVKQGSVAGTFNTVAFAPVYEYPSGMPVTLANSSQHNVQVHNKVELVADPSGTSAWNLGYMSSFNAAIQDMVVRLQDPWHEVGASGEPGFLGGQNYLANSYQLMFKLDSLNKELILRGRVKGINSSQIIFTSPYTPIETRQFPSFGLDNSGNVVPAYIRVTPGGDVSALWDGTTLSYLSLDGVRFSVD